MKNMHNAALNINNGASGVADNDNFDPFIQINDDEGLKSLSRFLFWEQAGIQGYVAKKKGPQNLVEVDAEVAAMVMASQDFQNKPSLDAAAKLCNLHSFPEFLEDSMNEAAAGCQENEQEMLQLAAFLISVVFRKEPQGGQSCPFTKNKTGFRLVEQRIMQQPPAKPLAATLQRSATGKTVVRDSIMAACHAYVSVPGHSFLCLRKYLGIVVDASIRDIKGVDGNIPKASQDFVRHMANYLVNALCLYQERSAWPTREYLVRAFDGLLDDCKSKGQNIYNTVDMAAVLVLSAYQQLTESYEADYGKTAPRPGRYGTSVSHGSRRSKKAKKKARRR